MVCTLICSFIIQFALRANVTPDSALERLMQGNSRYEKGEPLNASRDEAKRKETVKGQAPYAIILGCSDSRVSPEIIFDEGIGDLFVVRVAGNVVGPIELDSIEFAALTFNSAIILVLGHRNCGAVRAVIDGKTEHIEDIAVLIEPAVQKAKWLNGNFLENAVKMNVEREVEKLKNNQLIQKFINEGRVKVVGGYYDLESGKVEIRK
jgi:carbonic anhydrase